MSQTSIPRVPLARIAARSAAIREALRRRRAEHPAVRHARRVAVAIIGSTVILLGIVLIVLPGPATLVIPAGLAILATEFVWARRLLKKVRAQIAGISRKVGFGGDGDSGKTGK